MSGCSALRKFKSRRNLLFDTIKIRGIVFLKSKAFEIYRVYTDLICIHQLIGKTCVKVSLLTQQILTRNFKKLQLHD